LNMTNRARCFKSLIFLVQIWSVVKSRYTFCNNFSGRNEVLKNDNCYLSIPTFGKYELHNPTVTEISAIEIFKINLLKKYYIQHQIRKYANTYIPGRKKKKSLYSSDWWSEAYLKGLTTPRDL
jgi:hypothetical protein